MLRNILNSIIIAPKAKFVFGRIHTDWDVVPTVGVSLFCGHGIHSELPATSLYVLIGQKVQATFANPAENDPFGQISHVLLLLKNVPAGHGAKVGDDVGAGINDTTTKPLPPFPEYIPNPPIPIPEK